MLVCDEWVLDEQDIRISPGDLSLDISWAKGKISDVDRNAIEEANHLVEKLRGTVDALTYGTAARQSLKDVLSWGPNKVCWIEDPAADKADAHVIAPAGEIFTITRKLDDCTEGVRHVDAEVSD
jgi:electron transfer flavoprotein beta subunit